MYSAVVVGVLNTCTNIVIFWLFWLYICQHLNMHHISRFSFTKPDVANCLSIHMCLQERWSVTSVQNGLMST